MKLHFVFYIRALFLSWKSSFVIPLSVDPSVSVWHGNMFISDQSNVTIYTLRGGQGKMSMHFLIWRSRLIQGHWRWCKFHTSVERCYLQKQLDISFTLSAFSVFQPYMNYLEKQDDLLVELDKAQKNHKEFECIYKDFEAQKVCYLPLNTFLLKPGQRLLHYKLLLESKSYVYIIWKELFIVKYLLLIL